MFFEICLKTDLVSLFVNLGNVHPVFHARLLDTRCPLAAVRAVVDTRYILSFSACSSKTYPCARGSNASGTAQLS